MLKVGVLCLKINLKVVIKWRVSVELCILTISIQRELGSHKFASYKGGSFVLFSYLLKLLDFYNLISQFIIIKSINLILTEKSKSKKYLLDQDSFLIILNKNHELLKAVKILEFKLIFLFTVTEKPFYRFLQKH